MIMLLSRLFNLTIFLFMAYNQLANTGVLISSYPQVYIPGTDRE